jgi:hypothetical protein
VEFSKPAPGLLTEESGSFYADYEVADTHFGMTKAEVQAMLASVFSDGQGWERSGITFREQTSASVTIQVVSEAICAGADAACTKTNPDGTKLVELEYGRLIDPLPKLPQSITNHEAGHAFFYGTHEGSGSIMTGDGVNGWPTEEDIADVAAWLGITPDPAPTVPPVTGSAGGAYFFPGGLEHYITPWDFTDATEVFFYINVVRAAEGTTLKPVWGLSRDAVVEGRFETLTPPVSASARGTYNSGWLALPEGVTGEVWVGILARLTAPSVDIQNLGVGLAEVQIR